MTEFAMVTLNVHDYDEAIDYYVGKLGFRLLEDTRLDAVKRWVVVAPPSGGAALLLAKVTTDRQRKRVGDQTGGRVGFFLYTDDFARDHAAMCDAGVVFEAPPRHEPYGTVAVFTDLYGNRWDFIEHTR
ncbi:MAG: VOC family protein [Stackebrandtia sp.]